MLLVKTYIDKSIIPNAGLGCFSQEFISKGTKIWEYKPEIDREFDEIKESFSELEKSFIETYAFAHNQKLYLCVDNARFFNHSSKLFNTIDPVGSNCTYAARDINIGEEIISDYSSFGDTDFDKEFNLRGL